MLVTIRVPLNQTDFTQVQLQALAEFISNEALSVGGSCHPDDLFFQALSVVESKGGCELVSLEEESFSDLSGKPVFVGDTVAFTVPAYKHLLVGEVIKINPKTVTVSYTRQGTEQTTTRNPDQFVKYQVTNGPCPRL